MSDLGDTMSSPTQSRRVKMGEFIEVHVDVDERELLKTIEELQKQMSNLQTELDEVQSSVTDLEYNQSEERQDQDEKSGMTQDEITDLVKEIINDATISIDV